MLTIKEKMSGIVNFYRGTHGLDHQLLTLCGYRINERKRKNYPCMIIGILWHDHLDAFNSYNFSSRDNSVIH